MTENKFQYAGQVGLPPLNLLMRKRSLSRQGLGLGFNRQEALAPTTPQIVEGSEVFKQCRSNSTGNGLFHEIAEEMWERHKVNGVQSKVTNPLKALVSRNKKRFSWDGYDLDLAYITDNIIAMGFPSQKLESIYRNSMEDVKKFLNQRHHSHYRVYNLCSERKYDKENFDSNVAEMPFDDHNAPPFELIYDFCLDAENWLEKDTKNIVVVHCKAGKGRTGLMVCCLLLYSGVVETAEEALEYYGTMRTFNCKGVTIPSQRRYVHYFHSAINQPLTKLQYLASIPPIHIKRIRVGPIPKIDLFGGCTPWVQITNNGDQYKSKYSHELVTYKTEENFELTIDHKFDIKGDFKLEFFSKGAVLNKSEKFMHLWLNTYFMEGDRTLVKAEEIDGFKVTDARFSRNLSILIQFQRPF